MTTVAQAAAILAAAIEYHRDTKWEGGEVTDPRDAHLYNAALWFRTEFDVPPAGQS